MLLLIGVILTLSLSGINYSAKCLKMSFDLTPCQKQALCSLLSRWPEFTRFLAFVQDQMFMIICLLNPHAAGFYIGYNRFPARMIILMIYQHSNHCTEQLVLNFWSKTAFKKNVWHSYLKKKRLAWKQKDTVCNMNKLILLKVILSLFLSNQSDQAFVYSVINWNKAFLSFSV